MEQRRNAIRIERERVIQTPKPTLVKGITNLFATEEERTEFKQLCVRIEACIRDQNHTLFEELMDLQQLFDPQKNYDDKSSTDAQHERRFLELFHHEIMTKSNFKILKKEEWKIATSSKYILNLDVKLNESMLDDKLLRNYPGLTDGNEQLFHNRCLIYRRGIGCDTVQGYFMLRKIEEIQKSIWRMVLKFCTGKEGRHSFQGSSMEVESGIDQKKSDGKFVDMERVHVGDTRIKDFFQKVVLQDPTFSQVIVIYRKKDDSRGIHIKQFKDVPMADLELVLPEKKTPRLSCSEWVKLVLSAAIGVAGFWEAFKRGHSSFVPLAFTILTAFVGYCFKVYFTFHTNVLEYHRLMSKSIYDRQSDSHLGTLLHLCTNVINQETMETIIGFFVLWSLEKSKKEELALRCNDMMAKEFKEICDFEIDDAIQKLLELDLANQSGDLYYSISLEEANDKLKRRMKDKA